MTSFTVKISIEKDGEYYTINSYLDDLTESKDKMEDMIATLLAKTTLEKMNEIKKEISDGNVSTLFNEYEALVKEAIDSEKSE